MITREEALNILKALSNVEGYLYQVKDSSQILAVVDEQVKCKIDSSRGSRPLSGDM